jgi:DNA-binding transcriptional regulator YiaG
MSILFELETIVKILRMGGEGSAELAIALLERKIKDMYPVDLPEIKAIAVDLRMARLRAGLSQADLARKFQVSSACIGQWERGEAEPRAHMRKKLQEFIND